MLLKRGESLANADLSPNGILDDQWLARGYSPERYLSVMTDCMDLYRSAFGTHPLRICLAYGLRWTSNESWIYRRVAQAAVARGIGLKQNGLSELYDTWDEFTDASYLFDRYRFTPGVSLTHETGGQIYRNTLNAHGHPLSCINRALINGIDFLFLYGGDIRANHVRKYLPYASQLMGRALFSSYYCHLGDMTLHHDTLPSPTAYRHQWLGLRQVRLPGAEVSLITRAGSKCAATSPGNPLIIFDVDDRQQYSGMYHPTLTIEYWDGGTDCFQVRVLDAHKGDWRLLGEVRKQASDTWKAVSFSGTNWCQSPRNSGKDQQTDVVIDDMGDGIEVLRLVELGFVPAREWRTQALAANPPVAAHHVLTTPFDFSIKLDSDSRRPAVLSLPLWSGSLAPGGLRARVYADSITSRRLIADKSYEYPADHDLLIVPLHDAPGCGELTIELTRISGDVGFYLGGNGEPAWTLEAYAPHAVSVEGGLTDFSFGFTAEQPFVGISFQADVFNPQASLQLVRNIPDEWSGSPEIEVLAEPRLDSGEVFCDFDPHLPGRYELRVTPAPTNKPPLSIRVHQLVRRDPPRPPLAQSAGELVIDLFSSSSTVIRQERVALTPTASGALLLEITGLRPFIDFKLKSPLIADARHRLHLRLNNPTGCGMARLRWTYHDTQTALQDYTLIPLFPNDPTIRDLVFPIGIEPHWSGTIEGLALEPVTGGVAFGSMTIQHAWIDLDPEP